jgi:hypothetical protein
MVGFGAVFDQIFVTARDVVSSLPISLCVGGYGREQ